MTSDLISRSALLEQMHNHYEVRNPKQNATMDECCMMVIHAPAVDAVEVVHGYWENANNRPKTYIRKCSVCGKEAYFCGRGCSYKFCPNCGAKMQNVRVDDD